MDTNFDYSYNDENNPTNICELEETNLNKPNLLIENKQTKNKLKMLSKIHSSNRIARIEIENTLTFAQLAHINSTAFLHPQLRHFLAMLQQNPHQIQLNLMALCIKVYITHYRNRKNSLYDTLVSCCSQLSQNFRVYDKTSYCGESSKYNNPSSEPKMKRKRSSLEQQVFTEPITSKIKKTYTKKTDQVHAYAQEKVQVQTSENLMYINYLNPVEQCYYELPLLKFKSVGEHNLFESYARNLTGLKSKNTVPNSELQLPPVDKRYQRQHTFNLDDSNLLCNFSQDYYDRINKLNSLNQLKDSELIYVDLDLDNDADADAQIGIGIGKDCEFLNNQFVQNIDHETKIKYDNPSQKEQKEKDESNDMNDFDRGRDNARVEYTDADAIQVNTDQLNQLDHSESFLKDGQRFNVINPQNNIVKPLEVNTIPNKTEINVNHVNHVNVKLDIGELDHPEIIENLDQDLLGYSDSMNDINNETDVNQINIEQEINRLDQLESNHLPIANKLDCLSDSIHLNKMIKMDTNYNANSIIENNPDQNKLSILDETSNDMLDFNLCQTKKSISKKLNDYKYIENNNHKVQSANNFIDQFVPEDLEEPISNKLFKYYERELKKTNLKNLDIDEYDLQQIEKDSMMLDHSIASNAITRSHLSESFKIICSKDNIESELNPDKSSLVNNIKTKHENFNGNVNENVNIIDEKATYNNDRSKKTNDYNLRQKRVKTNVMKKEEYKAEKIIKKECLKPEQLYFNYDRSTKSKKLSIKNKYSYEHKPTLLDLDCGNLDAENCLNTNTMFKRNNILQCEFGNRDFMAMDTKINCNLNFLLDNHSSLNNIFNQINLNQTLDNEINSHNKVSDLIDAKVNINHHTYQNTMDSNNSIDNDNFNNQMTFEQMQIKQILEDNEDIQNNNYYLDENINLQQQNIDSKSSNIECFNSKCKESNNYEDNNQNSSIYESKVNINNIINAHKKYTSFIEIYNYIKTEKSQTTANIDYNSNNGTENKTHPNQDLKTEDCKAKAKNDIDFYSSVQGSLYKRFEAAELFYEVLELTNSGIAQIVKLDIDHNNPKEQILIEINSDNIM